jgi:hypothetical protein
MKTTIWKLTILCPLFVSPFAVRAGDRSETEDRVAQACQDQLRSSKAQLLQELSTAPPLNGTRIVETLIAVLGKQYLYASRLPDPPDEITFGGMNIIPSEPLAFDTLRIEGNPSAFYLRWLKDGREVKWTSVRDSDPSMSTSLTTRAIEVHGEAKYLLTVATTMKIDRWLRQVEVKRRLQFLLTPDARVEKVDFLEGHLSGFSRSAVVVAAYPSVRVADKNKR